MDIFTLSKTNYTNGVLVNGLTDKMWVERYLDPGEFAFSCPASSQARQTLALGTLISHVETKEVMMVENHEIEEGEEGTPTLKITGRSVDGFLENRISSGNNFGEKNVLTNAVNLYGFSALNSWQQAAQLISEHIVGGQISGADVLPNVVVESQVIGDESPKNARVVKRGVLHKEVLKILEATGLGIKTERPPLLGEAKLKFIIHQGIDKSATVQFSHSSGEIPKARYFWSIRKQKNSALVMGEFTSLVMRPSGVTGWDARAVLVDATDFDMKPTEFTADLTYIDSVLRQRGNEVIQPADAQTAIIVPTIAKKTRYKYRRDYNVGDSVYVFGNYGVRQKMRVTEYVEIEDAKGEYGYPTLSQI